MAEDKRQTMSMTALNRQLRAISNCNQAMLRSEGEQELLENICRIICEDAGYHMAWVGYAEQDEAKSVTPRAWAGAEAGYLSQEGLTWGDSPAGHRPLGLAIRSGETTYAQDLFSSEYESAPWAEHALSRNYRSAIAIPLKDDDAVTFGVLCIYSAQTQAFTPDEIKLLEDLASDLAFGITTLRTRLEHKRGEEIMQARIRLLEFADAHSMDELLTATLDEIEALTGSSIGFYHFVETDQQTLTLHSWSTNTINHMCTAEGTGSHYPLDQAGVWADGVRKRRALIHNDYASLPNRKGMPEGHAEVIREVVVPIFRGEQIVAIIGVGNKATDYDESDIEILFQLGDLSWDIAARMRVEEALREQEAKFRTVADYTYDWEYWLGPNQELLYMTPSCKRITGYSRAEFEADPGLLNHIVYPADRNTVDAHLHDTDHLEDALLDFRIVHRDGDIRWITHGCQAVYRPNGQFLGHRVSNRDDTKRKEAEQQLAASEQLFRTLVENSPDHIARYDLDLRRIYMNPAIQQLFKMPVVEAIGVTPMVASPISNPERYIATIKQAIETGEELSDEFSYLGSDGELHWDSIRFTPEFDSNGKVATVLTIGSEITKKKQVEEERQAHLHFLQSLDRINRVLQEEGDIKEIMNKALDEVLDIFDCDRTYLLYPCDPEAATWSVLLERTVPEYQGDLQLSLDYPINESVASKMRAILDSDHPLRLGPGTEFPISEFLQEKFHIRSFMATALYPSVDRPWELGIQQCSYDRVWTDQEMRLFEEISRRVSDGLNSLLILRNLRHNEKELRLAASVFANSQEGILISDTDNIIIDINPAFTRLTGYTRDEAIGQNPSFMSAGKQGRQFYSEMWQAINSTGQWQGEIWNRRKTGEEYAELLSIVAVKDDKNRLRHYVGSFSDITFIKQHEADLNHLAHHDALTSMPNRRLLSDRIEQAVARANRLGARLAVVYLDLDGFKPVNDLFGHEDGDRLLVVISQRLQSLSRSDDTVARLGGDEFVLLWNDIGSNEDCIKTIERVLQNVSLPTEIEDESVSVTASIGVTLYPDDNVDADSLLRHADHAMYIAKQLGKNRYQMYDARLERQISSRADFLSKIERSLDEGQFELYYQPKVNFASGTVQGVEALLRWNEPILGLIGPNEFLPLIENDSLALRMGRWVMEQAVRQEKIWDDMGIVLPISINAFPSHLKHYTFVDDLLNAIESHWPQMPKNRLLIEIVESSDLEEMEPIEQVIKTCKEQGVGFSLDDFGTGYSSLIYLRHLSIEELKIDRTFVRDMLEDQDDEAIVLSVIRLGQTFGLRVVAEGVESTEHAQHLIDLGCHIIQGYGMGRPMPAAALQKWHSDFLANGVRMS